MVSHHFYEAQTEQSFVKAMIVHKYFKAWSRIMVGQVEKYKKRSMEKKIAYLDLFSGPGRYDDGAASTPILILEHAIGNAKLREMLVTIFNDADINNAVKLRNEIDILPGKDTLKYPPRVYNTEVDTEIAQLFEQARLVPSLIFVDPWGYKGLTLQFLSAAIKSWGCDAICFFNYNRINMGLSNPLVEERMNALFGNKRAETLRDRIRDLTPQDRENAIVQEFMQALTSSGCFVHPFAFKNDQGTRTSHHIVFMSKHELGYTIMKEIMAKMSSHLEQGVASFTFNPADAQTKALQLSLFESSGPLDELKESLLSVFAGHTLTVEQAFQTHHIGTRYVEKNYRDAFREMEASGKISASIPAELRKQRAGQIVLKDVLFTFPSQQI